MILLVLFWITLQRYVSIQGEYAAVGLSKDDHMGEDLVFACTYEGKILQVGEIFSVAITKNITYSINLSKVLTMSRGFTKYENRFKFDESALSSAFNLAFVL
jgi:hypothetical protein